VSSQAFVPPADDEVEVEPMRTMTVSRGSLIMYAQPRVVRSLSGGVTVVPTRPLLWTGTTLELDSNTDSPADCSRLVPAAYFEEFI
jgi:hypothetical protein